ncbi:MAG: hypothetical protein GY757_54865 [bacterium]|nr:hypothetical protein [bacterium]
MSLLKWFTPNLSKKVLELLEGLKTKFEGLTWRDIVTKLSDFCEGELSEDDLELVNTVIGTLGLTGEVDKIKAFWMDIPEKTRDFFTNTLEENSEEMAWPIIGKDWGKSEFVGPWGSLIHFDPNVQVALELHALEKDSEILEGIETSCEDNERVLRMGLNGKLELSAGANLPLGFIGGSFKGNTDLKGQAELDYFFCNPAKELFVESVIKNIPHIPSPFNAWDIVEESKHNLEAIRFNIFGSVGASMELTGGKVWGASFKVSNKSLDLNADIDVGAGVGTTYKADLNLEGNWDVLADPLPESRLLVRVKNGKKKKKIDVSGVGCLRRNRWTR